MIRHPCTLALRKAEVNSVMRIAAHSALLFNSGMDIDEIRRQNIRALGDKIGPPCAGFFSSVFKADSTYFP